VLEYGGEDIEGVVRGNRDIVLWFYADWAKPSRDMERIAPSLDAVQGLVVMRVDAAKHIPVCEHYAVVGVPSFIRIHEGQIVARVMGYYDTSALNVRLGLISIPAIATA